jgi:virginiamycin B lyase
MERMTSEKLLAHATEDRMPQICRSRVQLILYLAAALGALTGAAPAMAQSFNEFPVPTAASDPVGVALGLDGNVWFTEFDGNKIGKITPAGTITEFTLPTNSLGQTSQPAVILRAPDGALWFTMTGASRIGRITTAGQTSFFTTPTAVSGPAGLAVGPDGNLWFTEVLANKIGRITLGGSITEFAVPTAASGVNRIAPGPDGNLWFTESQSNKIGQITTSGAITEFTIPTVNSEPWGIRGFDGAIWFTERSASKIAQISTGGQVVQQIPTPTANAQPVAFAAGPDGNLWFTEYAGNKVARLAGTTITEFLVPTPSSEPSGITIGSDGAFWFAEETGNKIARFLPLSSSIQLFGAVLPSSRSPQVGGIPATAFATIINAGSSTATACGIADLNLVTATVDYQTTNPATNALTGTIDTPVNIAAGASQSFVIAAAPTAPFPSIFVELGFACSNANAAPIEFGLDTLLYSASTTPVPDVVALAATALHDGILHITGTTGSNSFAVATVNVGAGGPITATANTGGATLPLTISLCQTNPSTGGCTTSIGSSVTTTINSNATPTFAIFAAAGGSVPFVPQTNRIFVEFSDAGGTVRGSTSVAVETQ